jgi:PAS domain S-box-containing protein
MPLKKLKGLKARLLVIVLLAMLPVLFLALYLAVQDYREAKAAAIDNCKRLVRGYASAATGSALLERARLVLSEISSLPGMGLDAQSCKAVLASVSPGPSLFSRIDVLRPDGSLVCSSEQGLALANSRGEKWFRETLASDKLVVGRYHKDRDGRPKLPLALCVRGPDGAPRAVFCMSLRLERLADMLDGQPLPEGAAVSLIDSDGTFLARYPADMDAVGLGAPEAERFLADFASTGQDTWQARGLDGVERIYLLAPLFREGEHKLYLRMGLPVEAAFAQAHRNLTRYLSFLGCMAALVLVAAWFFSNSLVLRHIRNIWLATRKLADGNYSYRIGATGGGELGELALAFDQMAGVLENRTAQLSEAERNFRSLFEHSVSGIFQSDVHGRMQIVNRAMADILGYASPEDMKEGMQDIAAQLYADPAHRRTMLARLDLMDTISGFEFPARRVDGDLVWLSMDARAIRDEDGALSGIEGMVTDITLRKTVEEELKVKQEKLQALLDYSPALISIKDAQGRYVLSNRMHHHVHALANDIGGRTIEALFPPDEARRIREEDRQVLRGGKAITLQRPLSTKVGTRHFMSVKFPLYDAAGRPDRVCSISYDVSDLERTREALLHSEEKYRSMIQTSPDLIWLMDQEGRLVEVNGASRELLGYEPEELRGKLFHQFFLPEDVQAHDRETVLPLFAGRRTGIVGAPKLINERRQNPRSTRNLIVRLVPKGGRDDPASRRSFELSSCGLWQDMRLLGTIVVIRDITERKRAERVSAMNEAHYRALLELRELRRPGVDELASAIVERAVALTRSEVGYLHVVDPADGSLEYFRWSGGALAQCRLESRTGRYSMRLAGIWADCVRTGEPALHNDYDRAPGRHGLPEGHVPLTRHLSVPMLQEDAIRAVLGVGNKPEPYDELDVEALRRFATDAWQIVARRRVEADLRRSQELLSQTQAMASIGGWTASLDTRACSWTEETARILDLGERGLPDYRQGPDALFFIAPEDRDMLVRALALAEENGEGFDLEVRLVPRGGVQRWIRLKAMRADTADQRVLSGMVQDITDRKSLELLRNDIDGIIRHDLKAPLNGIINLPQILSGDANLTPDQVGLLRLIEDSGRNMLRQIDMSLDLMKIERGHYHPEPYGFDLMPLLRDILLSMADFAATRRLALAIRKDGAAGQADSFRVHGEERLCYPLLGNLILNALEASPEGATVEIALSAGDTARIAIRNQGEIPLEIRQSFFEKFVTSGKTKGTGLGTYSAQLFARTQGGSVELDVSEPGATTLVVLLPLG